MPELTEDNLAIMEGNHVSIRELNHINTEVNNATQYKSDMTLYENSEFWTIANGAGDCEDYALAKREKLIEAGWPRECVKLACCWTDTGVYHAVLTVDTTDGTYVLDNRSTMVIAWEKLPYKWHMREIPGEDTWELIE